MCANVQSAISNFKQEFEVKFSTLIADLNSNEVPPRLSAAINHSVLNGGKRLRAFIVAEGSKIFDVNMSRAFRVGAAIECLHAYSLVHDDLPSMDNDALRRGKPTTHIEFDEATAILAGDALQTMAFEILSNVKTHPDANIRCELISALAKASGPAGMVGGQVLDLAAEGRFAQQQQPLSIQEIERLQAKKTGALIHFSATAGATIGKASLSEMTALSNYGYSIGAAFQLADDILDRLSNAETLGKAVSKDQAAGKATFIEHLGMDGAKQKLNTLVEEAHSSIEVFDERAKTLHALASYIATRDH